MPMTRNAAATSSVAIIGNGLMGQGISQVFARAGKRVTLIGRSAQSLEKAMTAIRGNIRSGNSGVHLCITRWIAW